MSPIKRTVIASAPDAIRNVVLGCLPPAEDGPDENEVSAAIAVVENKLASYSTIAANNTITANVHAECTLLHHHLQSPRPTPFSYIGVSKLSCIACHLLFKSYEHHASLFGKMVFHTKGSHFKLYFPWVCLPSPGSIDFFPDVLDHMTVRVKYLIKRHLNNKIAQEISDSTDASASSQGVQVFTEDSEKGEHNLYVFSI